MLRVINQVDTSCIAQKEGDTQCNYVFIVVRPCIGHLITDLTALCQILRIGFYEIVKLEMPPYAVVDEVFLWP